MARPREFDEEEVLGRALGVFRTKGFDGSTLDELEQATGLGPWQPVRCVRRQAGAVPQGTGTLSGHRAATRRWRSCSAPRPAAPRSWRLFRGVARDAMSDRERKGCMVTNCSIELADRDPDLACQAARSLDLFERGVRRRHPPGAGAGRDRRRARSRSPRPLPHRLHGGDAGAGPRPPRCRPGSTTPWRRSRRRCAERRFCSV